ncbi:MAG: nucleotide exchange factor GrpE [Defluviitaleaceae bacterium]|nr:nucleotide exchange factor GrpE [Defluviitaleaceae bacterium]MCL2239370.1 nucleotide exchange factor GrpE [Defluviitaleaceae bacterium]
MPKKKKRHKYFEEKVETGELPVEEGEAEILDAPEEADHETLYKETLDRYTRALAEFDNFRKRSIKEKAAQYDDGMRAAAEKLLPIVDNFERAMQVGDEMRENTFYQGIALIARQFTQALQDLKVEEIPAVPGTDFDPNLHNAVAHTEDENFGANQIADVLQKGYMHKDKVIRHSMVRVAN